MEGTPKRRHCTFSTRVPHYAPESERAQARIFGFDGLVKSEIELKFRRERACARSRSSWMCGCVSELKAAPAPRVLAPNHRATPAHVMY